MRVLVTCENYSNFRLCKRSKEAVGRRETWNRSSPFQVGAADLSDQPSQTMSDNHFTYLHMTEAELRMLDEDDDPCIREPLPDEGARVWQSYSNDDRSQMMLTVALSFLLHGFDDRQISRSRPVCYLPCTPRRTIPSCLLPHTLLILTATRTRCPCSLSDRLPDQTRKACGAIHTRVMCIHGQIWH